MRRKQIMQCQYLWEGTRKRPKSIWAIILMEWYGAQPNMPNKLAMLTAWQLHWEKVDFNQNRNHLCDYTKVIKCNMETNQTSFYWITLGTWFSYITKKMNNQSFKTQSASWLKSNNKKKQQLFRKKKVVRIKIPLHQIHELSHDTRQSHFHSLRI